nr:B3 domain-containing protein Os03g0212300-like [Aegilops tauschii subsp. strangulata]
MDALPAGGPGGFWLQADGCGSKALWVEFEVTATGKALLTCRWQSFARARDLRWRCTLHFRYDGTATLYVRIFGEDGPRVGCCPESDSDDDGDADDGRRGGIVADDDLALGDGRVASSSGGFSSAKSSSDDDSDKPLRHRARIGREDESGRRHAPAKREEGSE